MIYQKIQGVGARRLGWWYRDGI